MILIPLIALFIGAILAILINVGPVRGVGGQYLAIACLAGLDSVLGGIRSGLEGKFETNLFVTGFLSNILIAFFMAWLGDQIYINLFLATTFVFGQRIFDNLAKLRRIFLTWLDDRRRRTSTEVAS
ncbi:MAG: small basic family protein [Fimbriimonadaceae bacterium]|nr:small basic family protein [Fimbriimonadaceae bacterium]